MSYAMVSLRLGSGGKAIEPNAKAPRFRDFHNGIWAGEVSLVSDEARAEYGRVRMKQVLENMRTVRFLDALRIVSDRHAKASF
jgi:hypothetical protein